ncbi:MAG: sporulation protein YqfD [Lachnospiraceae bacterium]|nr:sporulation protein YqfD [Lachnospiraceae bacterium]
MIRLIRFIKGYVEIEVYGFALERFLNLCSVRNLFIWNIKIQENSGTLCISLQGFFQLKDIVRKSRTRVVIRGRYGLPFLIQKYKKRIIFILGIPLCLIFCFYMNLFIWLFDFSGNSRLSDEALESFLQDQNITIGMKKTDLDLEELEQLIRKSYHYITWTSAKLNGTRLIIQVKENAVTEKVKTNEAGSNLIAEKKGKIISIVTRKGVPLVKSGDQVEPGQILVSGMIPVVADDETLVGEYPVQADADIILEYVQKYNKNLDALYVKKTYTGRSYKRYVLQSGTDEFVLPVGASKRFKLGEQVKTIKPFPILSELHIPAYWGHITEYKYQLQEAKYDRNEAEKILRKQLQDFISDLEQKGVQIIEKNVTMNTKSSGWTATGTLILQKKQEKRMPVQ